MKIINSKLNILILLTVVSIALSAIFMVVWFDVRPGDGAGSGITSIKKAEKYSKKNTIEVELDSTVFILQDQQVVSLLNDPEFQKFMRSAEFNKFRRTAIAGSRNRVARDISKNDLQKFMKSNQFQKFLKGENFNKFQKQFN